MPEEVARIGALPMKDRVALALSAVDRASFVLSRQTYFLKLLSPAVVDARSWHMGDAVSARKLYGHIHPLRQRGEEDDLVGPEFAAFSAVVYALYYITWHARQEEGPIGAPLPNDIREISEQTLFECLEFAEQACKVS